MLMVLEISVFIEQQVNPSCYPFHWVFMTLGELSSFYGQGDEWYGVKHLTPVTHLAIGSRNKILSRVCLALMLFVLFEFYTAPVYVISWVLKLVCMVWMHAGQGAEKNLALDMGGSGAKRYPRVLLRTMGNFQNREFISRWLRNILPVFPRSHGKILIAAITGLTAQGALGS